MAKWIMVVDDDTANLQMAGHILSKNNIRVTALKSGKAMLDYIAANGAPNLILLDIKMPEMDGFETLDRLRLMEKEREMAETPVIFLTADEDSSTETRGFEKGVSDFIRKPFNPDVLLRRIDNVVNINSEMRSLKSEATIDKLTGLLNKAATSAVFTELCSNNAGCLMMIDLDSFKLVNDIFGHEMGDKLLISFANIINETIPAGSKAGRIGGDEFTAFCIGVNEDEKVAEITTLLNDRLVEKAKELMGEEMNIPLGASVGAIYVPTYGNDYSSLLKLADVCLYKVKKHGKHGYEVYTSGHSSEDGANTDEADIHTLSEILGERNVPSVAMQLGMEPFSYVYRYILRYIARHNVNACKALFTIHKPEEDEKLEAYQTCCDDFGNHVRSSLRRSDIITRSRYNQYYVFLTEIREEFMEKVIESILERWYQENGRTVRITYETEFIRSESANISEHQNGSICVVDDDPVNIQMAGKILGAHKINVIGLKSGQSLLDHVENNEDLPDLILLDIRMPEMDGFETLLKLRQMGGDAARVPVVFLTADNSDGAEVKGLSYGAMDFIRKPFIPEVLVARVNHLLELVMLRKRYRKV